MGKKDSTLTRVVPVFDQLFRMDPNGSWLSQLIRLPVGGHVLSLPIDCRLVIKDYGWGSKEKKLQPPVALLSWLIRNLEMPITGNLSSDHHKKEKRLQLINGSSERISEAIRLLRQKTKNKNWHIFEGETQPDVFIQTDDIFQLMILEEHKNNLMENCPRLRC